MRDGDKSKEQLIRELQDLRQQVAELEQHATIAMHLDAIPVAIFTKDLEGRYTLANADTLTYWHENPIGYTDADLLPQAIAKALRDTDVAVMQSGEESYAEETFSAPNGLRTLLSRKVPLTNMQGDTIGILGISLDITQRKQYEAAQQAFLRDMQALQQIHLELSRIDNLATLYRRMVELTQQELGMERVGLFIVDQVSNELIGTFGVDAEGRLRDESYYREAISDGHWTIDVLNSEDHVRFWGDAPIYDDNTVVGNGWKAASTLWDGHNALGYLVIDSFVTRKPARPYEKELISLLGTTFGHLIQRKRAEAALRQSEMQYKATVVAIPDMIFRIDKAGNFLDFHIPNISLLKILPDNFIDKTIQEFLPEYLVNELSAKSQQSIVSQQVVLHEFETNFQNEVYHFEARITSIGNKEFLAIIRDITNLKLAQRRELALLLEQERVHILKRFIEKASHEFRTPLSVIHTSTYLITRSDDADIRQLKARIIERQIERMNKLTDMLLKVVRLETISMKVMPVDVSELIKWLVTKVQKDESTAAISYEVQPDLPLIMGSGELLGDAFQQIIFNAQRYTPIDGHITIVVHHDTSVVTIEVRDTGDGISEDDLPLVFNMFWRKDEAHTTPGLGLGLAIAQKIIELHNGKIAIDSIVGQGTTVTIRLPLNPEVLR